MVMRGAVGAEAFMVAEAEDSTAVVVVMVAAVTGNYSAVQFIPLKDE